MTNEDLYQARIDHTFWDKDAIHGTFLYNNSLNTAPDVYDITLLGEVSNRRQATIEESHIFGPTLANFARFGFNRTMTLAPETATAINPLGADPSLGFAPGSNIGELQITGLTTFAGGLNSEGTYAYHYNTYQFYDDLFWTRGTHSFKFGGSIERVQSNELGSTTTGYFVFGSFSNFLQNIPSTYSSAVPGATTPMYLRQTIPAIYAQDDWRLRRNLTLNLGLRYEMASVPTEAHNNLSVLPSLGATAPHLGSPYFSNPTKRDFSPRIGIAWDPFGDGRTAIRAAYGIYDALPLTYQFSLLALNTEPYALTASLAKPPKGSFPSQAYGLAVDAQTLRNVYIEQHPHRSYVEQWSANIQQQLKWDTVLQAGYNGSHGVHQVMRDNDANIVLPTDPGNSADLVWPTPGTGTRLNPTAGTIDTLIWDGSNVYDALTARVSRSKKVSGYKLRTPGVSRSIFLLPRLLDRNTITRWWLRSCFGPTSFAAFPISMWLTALSSTRYGKFRGRAIECLPKFWAVGSGAASSPRAPAFLSHQPSAEILWDLKTTTPFRCPTVSSAPGVAILSTREIRITTSTRNASHFPPTQTVL